MRESRARARLSQRRRRLKGAFYFIRCRGNTLPRLLLLTEPAESATPPSCLSPKAPQDTQAPVAHRSPAPASLRDPVPAAIPALRPSQVYSEKYIALLHRQLELSQSHRSTTAQLQAVSSQLHIANKTVAILQAQVNSLVARSDTYTSMPTANNVPTSDNQAVKPGSGKRLGVGKSMALDSTLMDSDFLQAKQATTSSATIDTPTILKRTERAASYIDSSAKRVRITNSEKKERHSTSMTRPTFNDSDTPQKQLAFQKTQPASASSASFSAKYEQPFLGGPGFDIGTHVLKLGTGSGRVIRCKYCPFKIPSNNKSYWARHVGHCTSSPTSIKLALRPPSDWAGLSNQLTSWMNTEVCNYVTIKPADPATGAKKSAVCNYCQKQIASDKKIDWVQHMAHCSIAPQDVHVLFDVRGLALTESMPPPQMKAESLTPSSPALDESAVSNKAHSMTPAGSPINAEPEQAAAQVNASVPLKELTQNETSNNPRPDLAPYPTPAPPVLPDGSPNTLNWRAWSDVIKYQRPSYMITNMTGLKMTTFKKLAKFREIRLPPDGRNGKSACAALPEHLHSVFLDHVDGKPIHHHFLEVSTSVESLAVSNPVADSELKEASNSGIKKSSMRGTKYTNVLSAVMPGFKALPDESRKSVKRAVRLYLQAELKERISDWLVVKEGGTMFVVPDDVLPAFKEWAFNELSRCFPDMDVLKLE
ncbi:hypothetical protein BC830DRAFT_1172995 [Chytriomyces sp. MP71]|nr:hypothetical protein BC830DRAFT_1172995 [Chytriomyces sp. MP71]